MKKNLLFAAALLMSVAVSAQTVVWPCTGTTSDINIDATVTGSTTITGTVATPGSGIKSLDQSTACQATIKDANGTAVSYPSESLGIYKWVPTVANGSTDVAKSIEAAVAANQYVDFKIEETDVEKYIVLNNIKFDAWRYGTDAVRMNAKILAASDDGDYESEYLINATTAAMFGDEYENWIEATGAEGEIPGYMPSREDASKSTANKNNGNSSSHITLAKPTDFPETVYEMTLRIYIYGIADNKAAGLYNVTFNLGNTDGINNIVTSATANTNAPVYNLQGQQVSRDYKGVCIQNGRKFINK